MPVRGAASSRGRSRALLLALSGTVVIAGLAGCDGGPGFSTSIEVSNRCDSDVAVALSGSAKVERPSNSIRSGIVRRSETVSYAIAAVKEPGGDVANAWVVVAGAPSWGEPTEIKVDDLAQVTLPNGKQSRRLTIEGDLCP